MRSMCAPLFLLAAVCLLGGNLAAAGNCSSYNSCDSCRGAGSCYWCYLQGSGDYACSSYCQGEFRFHGECPAPTPAPPPTEPCKGYFTCNSCVNEGCDWCPGQTGGNYCAAAGTAGCQQYCEAPPPVPASCSAYTNTSCSTCTNNGCSWCGHFDRPNTCEPADQPGCTTTCGTDHCSQYDTCDSCTGAPSGDCGWCGSSFTCTKGTSTGPSSGFCGPSDWSWYAASCYQPPTPSPAPPSPPTPAPPACNANSRGSCLDMKGCYWCLNIESGHSFCSNYDYHNGLDKCSA